MKNVLVGTITGTTTASYLGPICQSLHDKTDGCDCIVSLSNDRICTCDKAVQNLQIITTALDCLCNNTRIPHL